MASIKLWWTWLWMCYYDINCSYPWTQWANMVDITCWFRDKQDLFRAKLGKLHWASSAPPIVWVCTREDLGKREITGVGYFAAPHSPWKSKLKWCWLYFRPQTAPHKHKQTSRFSHFFFNHCVQANGFNCQRSQWPKSPNNPHNAIMAPWNVAVRIWAPLHSALWSYGLRGTFSQIICGEW